MRNRSEQKVFQIHYVIRILIVVLQQSTVGSTFIVPCLIYMANYYHIYTLLLFPVMSCEKLSKPSNGWMECSGLYGKHSLNSSCQFFCATGYKLSSIADLHCNSSGAWNAHPPICAGAKYQLFVFLLRILTLSDHIIFFLHYIVC